MDDTEKINPSLQIYPNPADNILYLETGTKNIPGITYSIYDINGSLLIRSYIEGNSGRYEIPTDKLYKGCYLLQVEIRGRLYSEKFEVLK